MTNSIAWVTSEMLIAVEGDDARTWLNGQMTNDLKALSPEHAVYGLILNVKGRILADVLAIEDPAHGILMAIPEVAWTALSPHLEHHIIMEDVTLTPRPELAVVTVQSTETMEAPGPGWLQHGRLGVGGGWDRVVQRAESDRVLSTLSARAVTEGDAEPQRIRAGRPRYPHDFGETTYPQEAGLEKGAVSFTKGCYLGQEVVCMLESRGQISRRLVQLEGPGLVKGSELLDAEGQKVGQVTSSSDEGRALGFVKRAHAQPGAELSVTGGKATVVALASLGAE